MGNKHLSLIQIQTQVKDSHVFAAHISTQTRNLKGQKEDLDLPVAVSDLGG